MEPLTILFLAILNFFLSFLSVIVGGGGLIMVPLLIILGVPPPSAVAMTRFYNVGTGGASLFEFNRGGKVDWKIGMPLAVMAVFASLIGAHFVLNINESLLKITIGIIIIFILSIMMLNKKIGVDVRQKSTANKRVLGFVLTLFIVIISTMSGGGGGTLLTYVLIFLFGQTFLESMGTRKIITFAALTFSAAFFILAGVIIYEIAIPLLITGALGGIAGARYAMKKGDKWVRMLFIIIAFVLALNMIVHL